MNSLLLYEEQKYVHKTFEFEVLFGESEKQMDQGLKKFIEIQTACHLRYHKVISVKITEKYSVKRIPLFIILLR